MKNLLMTVAIATMALTFFSCTTEAVDNFETEFTIENNPELQANDACDDAIPEARITNNGTVAVNLDIIDENGEVVGFVHNLLPGNTSSWISFPAGETLFSVSNDTYVADVKVVHNMTTCMIYDMVVESNNELGDNGPEGI